MQWVDIVPSIVAVIRPRRQHSVQVWDLLIGARGMLPGAQERSGAGRAMGCCQKPGHGETTAAQAREPRSAVMQRRCGTPAQDHGMRLSGY